jgi:hypothetical protein
MVKIQTRTIRKKYRDKLYSYKQHLVPLPLTRNSELVPFLGRQLDFSIKDGDLILTLKKPMEEQQDEES